MANALFQFNANYGARYCHFKDIWKIWNLPMTEECNLIATGTTPIDIMGQRALQFELLVVGREVEACLVAVPLALAVAERQEGVAVGGRGGPAYAPHLQLAGGRLLEVLGPLRRLEDHADVDRVHVLLPLLDQLPRLAVGLRGVLDRERAAVGQVPPSVAVAGHVAVEIEQRLRARRVVVAHLGFQRRRIAPGFGRDDSL